MTLYTSSVSLPVIPSQLGQLASLIAQLRKAAQSCATGYTAFMEAAPALHYMSLSLVESTDLDPLFVIEVNFERPGGVFWLQLDAAIGSELREMLRCCKRPRNSAGDLYDAVTETGTRLSVAAYLENRAQRPSVYHHGNRGLRRKRILDELELFRATRTFIATEATSLRALPPSGVHRALRNGLRDSFPWLAEPAEPRVAWPERVENSLRFAWVAILVLLVLSVPGFVAARLMTLRWFLIIAASGALLIAFALRRMRGPAEGTAAGDGATLVGSLLRNWRPILAGAAIYLVVVGAIGVLATAVLGELPWRTALTSTLQPLLLSFLATSVLVIPGLVLWLRTLELDDSTQDEPRSEHANLVKMARREDWICQNHMISVVLLKPGVLRGWLVHMGHMLLFAYIRLRILDGYLGGMRTIHFAHWAFVDNGARLMFHSNYDLSWEAYLDDFIEKAHEGLTLAWSSGLGFPPTNMLVGDGASHGRLFKAWARKSMSETGFWYCAYPELTVDQIERNFRIATGLRRARLTDKAAATWMADL